MIDEKTKTSAVAKLKMKESVVDVASKMALPVPLVQEWYDNLSPRDLVMIEANVSALENVLAHDIDPSNEPLIRARLEDATLAVAKEIEGAAGMGDMIHSKSLHLLSDAIVKLYAAYILKTNGPNVTVVNASHKSVSMFQSLLKD